MERGIDSLIHELECDARDRLEYEMYDIKSKFNKLRSIVQKFHERVKKADWQGKANDVVTELDNELVEKGFVKNDEKPAPKSSQKGFET